MIAAGDLRGVTQRLISRAVVGNDLRFIGDAVGLPEIGDRQLARRAWGARWPWGSRCRLPLQVRDNLGQDSDHQLVLGGDRLRDALIDVIERKLSELSEPSEALISLVFSSVGSSDSREGLSILLAFSQPDGSDGFCARLSGSTSLRVILI